MIQCYDLVATLLWDGLFSDTDSDEYIETFKKWSRMQEVEEIQFTHDFLWVFLLIKYNDVIAWRNAEKRQNGFVNIDSKLSI